MHSFWMPFAEPTYRCGGCGLVWEREPNGRASHPFPEAPVYAEPDADGWLHCCEGRRFRWGQPVFYTVPAVPVTATDIAVYTIE